MLEAGVSLRSDGLQALPVHQLGCGGDLSDEEGIWEPDDVGGQGDSRNLAG